ncbi:MAG: WD40 repeat domain-containing serine/threonine protein kinase, partial [Planctomycetota bacterium]
MPDHPLRRLASDRYTDFTLIGKGGMGVVYLALDSELNRQVAFKMVRPDAGGSTETPAPTRPLEASPPTGSRSQSDSARSFEELRIRFLQEAWVTGAMEHPGVVPVYELGETEEGIPYYTMRYVTGERTLKAAIESTATFEDRLALLEPFLKVCDTLRYAHSRGIVHRDLKPENIGLGSFGEVILLDWGLAKMEGRPDVSGGDWRARIDEYRRATDLKTVAGALGTPGFMSPEAALAHSEDVEVRSDVYSLGAILYVILTGRLPFEFENFLEYVNLVIREDPPRADAIDESVPGELADICARALHREPDERFESVDELAAGVRRWQVEGPIEREVRALLKVAHQESESGKHLTGTLLLLHLDRATTAVNRILHLRPGHLEALDILQRVKGMRERGIRARVRTERLVVLQRVAAALLTVGAIVALVVFGLLSEEQERAAALRQSDRDQLADAEAAVALWRRNTDDTRDALARALASVSYSLLEDKRAGAARVAAAAALTREQNRTTWRALAAAESNWAPTLRWVLYNVYATAIAFDPDDPARVVIGDDEGVVHELTLAGNDRKAVVYEAFDAAVSTLAMFSESGENRIAAGSADGQVALIVRGNARATRLMPEHLPPKNADAAFEDDTLYRGTAVTAILPGPLPSSLIVGYADGRLRLFDDEGNVVHVARHHAAAITSLRGTDDIDVIYSGSEDGSVNFWRSAALLLQDSWSTKPARPVAGFRIQEDGEQITAWAPDGSTWSWQRDSGAQNDALRALHNKTHSAVLAARGRILVAASADGSVSSYDAANGALLHAGQAADAHVTAMRVTNAGSMLAVARSDGAIRFWDLDMNSENEPRMAAVDPENGRVFHVRPDNTVEVLSNVSPKPVVLGNDHTARVTALAPSADGARLLTVALDGRIVVWDVERNESIRTVRGRGDVLTAVAWAEGDGRFLT